MTLHCVLLHHLTLYIALLQYAQRSILYNAIPCNTVPHHTMPYHTMTSQQTAVLYHTIHTIRYYTMRYHTSAHAHTHTHHCRGYNNQQASALCGRVPEWNRNTRSMKCSVLLRRRNCAAEGLPSHWTASRALWPHDWQIPISSSPRWEHPRMVRQALRLESEDLWSTAFRWNP